MRKINDRSPKIHRMEDFISVGLPFVHSNEALINGKKHKTNKDHYPEDHKMYGLTEDEFIEIIKSAMEKL